MWKLMKLELQKHRLRWYPAGAAIASVLIVLLICMICYVEKAEGGSALSGLEEMFIIGGSLVRATFIVFAAVLISKLIIEEYKSKTVQVLFMYPISRRKLMAAKLLIVFGLTLVTMVLSSLFVYIVFLAVNHYLQLLPGSIDEINFGEQLISLTAFSVAAAGTSLVPLYMGMRNHSVPATIVSSFVIVAVISGHNPAYSIASIIYIPAALAIVGIAVAWRSLRNIERADLH